jgi:N-acyl homoserine lactone hydrolase
MRLLAVPVGSIDADQTLVGGGDGTVTYPVMCFLLEAAGERVLFDTGMHPAVRDDAVGHWGEIARRRLVPTLDDDGDVLSRLRAAGLEPDDVGLLVNSHLHNDHAGMNLAFPRTRTLLRRREYEHAVSLMDTPSSGFVRADFFDAERPAELFDYETSYDLLGDGSVVLLSTPGHTPGHQSMLLRFPSGVEYVLSGDAVYSCGELEQGRAPGIAWDAELAGHSARRLQVMAQDGANVLVCHDAATWAGQDQVTTIHSEE